jgi:hypothetical protein
MVSQSAGFDVILILIRRWQYEVARTTKDEKTVSGRYLGEKHVLLVEQVVLLKQITTVGRSDRPKSTG